LVQNSENYEEALERRAARATVVSAFLNLS